LRQRYPTTVNLGHTGYGPLITLAALKEYLPALRPKTVVWAYYEGNDFANLEEEAREPELVRYLERGYRQNLVPRQAEIDRALAKFLDSATVRERRVEKRRAEAARLSRRLRRAVKLPRLRALLQEDAVPSTAPTRQACCDYDLFQRILKTANAEVASWGGTIVFVYLPSWDRFGVQGERWSKQLQAREQVFAIVSDLGLRIIDVTEAFQAQPDPTALFYYPGSHYNIAGARIAAQAVLRGLAPHAPVDR
jgi:hypothetical protein